MQYTVTAIARNRRTREPVGEPRAELIDTETNALFRRTTTREDVRVVYESFWNDLNPLSAEVVEVLRVEHVVH